MDGECSRAVSYSTLASQRIYYAVLKKKKKKGNNIIKSNYLIRHTKPWVQILKLP